MATTPKPPPPHGTRACYLRGCRQPECSTAHYRYMSRLKLDHHRGHRRLTPATTAANHIRQLTAANWSLTQIATTAQCSTSAIIDIHHGKRTTITPTTEQRILTVPLGPPPAVQYADPTGTVRRVRALVAIGYPITRIGPAIGLTRGGISRIARGEVAGVLPATARAIADLYREWAGKPGTSTRARAHAAREGWHGPLAWDDNIDDPTALPEVDEPATQDTPRYVAIAQDCFELERTQGYTRTQAAVRLGVTRNYLDASIRRYRLSAYGEAA